MEKTKLDPKFKKKWVAALRSGDYEQGTKRLCRITPDGAFYCCLGVAAELIQGEDAWEVKHDHDTLYLNGRSGDYAVPGLTFKQRSLLAAMNDGTTDVFCRPHEKHTFAQIADYIDENF